MAQTGFDTAFGLRGVTSHVDGFGGTPLAVFTDSDGRPTLVCVALARRAADLGIAPAGRVRAAKVATIRIVSFPSTGRPWGGGPTVAISKDPVDVDVEALRVITSPSRVAVLVAVSQAGQRVARVLEYGVTARASGVNQWGLVRQRDLPGAIPDHTTIGWDSVTGDVIVVEATVDRKWGRRSSTWYVDYAVRVDPRTNTQFLLGRVLLPRRPALHSRFTLTTKPGPLLSAADGRIFVTLSVEGLDRNLGLIRPMGTVDAGRAVVVCLTADGNGGWEPDPGFGAYGAWVSGNRDKNVVDSASAATFLGDGNVVIAGRSRRGGVEGVTISALDAITAAELWSSTVSTFAPRLPVEVVVDQQGRVVLGGFIDPTRVAFAHTDGTTVMRFDQAGVLDATFGVGGTAAVRLHGATVPAAVASLATGGYLVAGCVRWGRFTAAGFLWDPCVAKLTDSGAIDTGFGNPGMCRHDGLGHVSASSWGPNGVLWAAGVRRVFLRMVPPAFPGRKEHPEYDWVLTVSHFDAAGELPVSFPWAQASFPMTRFVPVANGNAYDVLSVVALHGGGAVVSGIYQTLTINEMTDDVDLTFGGSWIIRLRPDGMEDPRFGTGGVRKYPNASIMLTTELADGSLQGFDWTDVIRLTPDGLLDPNFGMAGRLTMGPHDQARPRTVAADGSWLDVRESFSTAGLVRYFPNGTLDPTFGATANTAAAIDVSTVVPKPGMQNLRWNELDDHQTVRLADGTFLTLWSVKFETSGWQDATAVVLLAWAADGARLPRWNGQAAKIIEPPGALLTWERWYSRRPTGGLLQGDGSVLVGVAADVRPGGLVTPQRLPWRSTIWRLTPPEFELDPNFGATGSAEVRLPDDGYNPMQDLVDVQEPVAFAAGAGQVVYASIRCGAVKRAALLQNAATLVGSPDLPFDGSLGIVRLA